MLMMLMPNLWNEDMDICGTVRKADPVLYKKNGGPADTSASPYVVVSNRGEGVVEM